MMTMTAMTAASASGRAGERPSAPIPAACYRKPELREVRADQFSVAESAKGQLVAQVRHDVIEGITPEMLLWWYRHIDQTVQYNGATCPMYYILLPEEHEGLEVLDKGPDGLTRVGSRFHVRELFHSEGKEYPVDDVVLITRIDAGGIAYAAKRLGITAATVFHQWTAVPGGTKVVSTFTVGTAMEPAFLRRLINARARKEMPAERLRAWAKHNVEEIGNLPNVLPLFYKAD